MYKIKKNITYILPWLKNETKDPRKWGNKGWSWLRTRAIKYCNSPGFCNAKNEMSMIYMFVRSLPCDICYLHAVEYIRHCPPLLSSSASYQTWVWKFHNRVNNRLGKKTMNRTLYLNTYKGAKLLS